MPSVIRRVIFLLALPVMLLGVTVTSASAAPATAAGGWIRLAHLSPNTPAVDVYLYSLGNPDANLVLHHVAYGAVSPYEPVKSGDYTVAMRAAGAAPATKPVLSTSVSVTAGHAYTVAGMGPESGIRLQVLDDQLTPPSGGALVRIIQASLKQHVVTVDFNDSPAVSNLAFASVSGYKTVSPGDVTVHVVGSGAKASSSVDLTAGTVHTLVVLDGASGLTVDNITDAAGSTVAPTGGAATGFGGTAPRSPSPLPWLLLIAAGVAVAVTGGLGLRRFSRSRA
jgi:hypothetical protein